MNKLITQFVFTSALLVAMMASMGTAHAQTPVKDNIATYTDNGDGTTQVTFTPTEASLFVIRWLQTGGTVVFHVQQNVTGGQVDSPVSRSIPTGYDFDGEIWIRLSSGDTDYARATHTTGARPDTTPPTVTLGTIAEGVIGTAQDYDITFSEAVTGLAVIDFSVSNDIVASGDLVVNSVTPASGPSTTYTISITPRATAFTLTLAADSVTDTATTPNTGPETAASVSGTATAAPPGAPTGLTARPGDATVTLAWTAPGATGGADITGYEYRQSDAMGDYDTTGSAAVVDWMAIPNSATATEYTVAGLTNNTAYFFQVRAVNSGGKGEASDEATATPTAPNTAPVIGTADAAVDYAENTPVATAVATYTATDAEGDTVTWTLGGTDAGDFSIDTNGALTFNTVRDFETPDSGATSNTYFVTITATDDGDPNESGTLDVTVTVTNVDDEAGVVAIAITRDGTTVSGAPRVGDTLTASVTDADSGSAGVTGTTWQWQSSSAGSTTNISGATDAAYSPVADDVDSTLQAVATYNDSTGSTIATSDPTATVTAAPPGAPTGLTARPGDATVTLAWTAPGATGGADITGYEYRQSDATGDYDTTGSAAVVDWMAIPNSATATEYTVAGLTNDTAYFFQVRAVNSGGESEASGEATATPTAANTAPVIGIADAAVDYAENTPVATAVATYTATDAEGDTVTWTLGGTDAGDFSIDTNGALTFNTVRDFETPASDATSNIYSVTITATDDGDPNESDTLDVTVTVTNVDDEAGVVAIAITRDGTTVSGAPRVGDTLTASVTDADSGSAGVTGTTWQWQSSSAGSTTDISGATAAAYSPVADDVDSTLQAVATYNDSTDSGKTATSDPTATVTAAPPGAPTGLTARPGDATVTLAWTAPGATGGAGITGYEYRQSDAMGDYDTTGSAAVVDWMAIPNSATATEYTVAGLTNDTAYFFEVRAVNSVGESEASDEATATPTAANTAPVIGTADAAVDYAENTPVATAVATYTATDAEGDTVTWTLGGTDAGDFSIDTNGALTFNTVRDFETPASVATSNIYSVTITATDDGDPNESDTLDVTVTVTNVDDEDGVVAIAITRDGTTVPGTPRVGDTLTASVTDADSGSAAVTGTTWQWQSSSAGSTTNISGATDAAYSPVAGDVGSTLQAVATYNDSTGSGKTATSAPTAPVVAPLVLTTAGDQGYTLGTTITELELPAATGGTAPLTYALTNLPDGLRFDAGTRTLSGTPGTAAITELTYTVTDANGASTSQTFTVTVNDSLALSAPPAQSYTAGTLITPLALSAATGGTGTLSYTLTGPAGADLPTGLTFTAASRTLSGTPTAAASTVLTYTVTDANGASTSQTFTVTVNDGLVLTTAGDQGYTLGTTITELELPAATGGTAPLTYALTNLPDGLRFDAGTRTLSGTPGTAAITVLTYTVTDANGASTSQTFMVTVSDGLALSAPPAQSYTAGTLITPLALSAATGGTGTLSYTLTGPAGADLPTGLTFTAASRTLSGTPTAAASTVLTYTVTDTNDATASQTFTVTVNDGLVLTTAGDQGYTLGTTITELELPAATGGTAPLTYALTNLPDGLRFDAGTRTLSGTPGTAAITVLTYTVTDANDASTSQTFTVTVNDSLALSAPPAQSYTAGTLITPLALSAATGGTGTLSYTLTGPAGADLPTGLTFTAASRTLSGTPTAAASTVLTYTVTDTNDATASQTFTVTVNDGLVLTTAGDQGYTLGTTITELELPAATGGTAPLTYALTNLPDGLRFDAGTRTLSGTPGTAAITELTYTVTDANGASTSQTFTVTVNDGLVLTTAGDQGYTLGTTITELELPEATGGTAPLTYALTNLPDGLRFDAGTRTLSGTPGTAAITELTYTVTDANGASTSQTFMVTVNDSLALTAPDDQSYTVDTAITDLVLLEASGGTGTLTYTLTGLPTGLTFTAASRTLSGTPTAAASTVLTYTVTDANGASTSQTFTVTVNDGLVLTTAGDQGYTLDTAIDALILPEATGGTAPLTYALTDPPAGLTFNSASRRLTGTPGTAAITELTYTVTDANDASTSQTFMVTVNDSLALTAPDDQSYTVDTAITDLVLLEATGGTGTLSYTLTGPAGADLPTGLTFTAASRTLSGTPTAAASTVLTYTVTDANGASTSQTFTVTVNDGLVLTTAGDQGYTLGTTITELELPAATGGTAPLTYALTNLPDGLRFDAGTRTLSGTPGTAAITVLTYTVTDANGASTSQTFMVTVSDGLALSAPPAQSYTAGTLITPLALSAATGGTGTLSYTLTGPAGADLPTGLTFTAASRTLSGTPTAAASTVLTYTVTDTNDATASQTFTVTVNDGLVLTTAGDQGYTLGTTITELELPAATGGTAPLTYALTNLPDGLRFDAGTRTLSGTPGTAAITVLTYTVTDANDASTSQTFMVTVNDSLALSAPPAQSYTAGTLITPLALSAATGGTGTLSYTLTGPAGADLPTGLTFTAASRTLSGTPTAAASTVLTYTVTDTNDATASQTFTVTVNDGLVLTTAGDQGYTLGTTITELELPAATGGTAPLTYALTNLPDGLRFDAGTRTLSGTPGTAAITELTYTVTDANGASTSQTFTVTVNDGLVLTTAGDQGYTLGTTITELELPEATGGTAPLTYALTNLPDGLRFDAGTRTLSGTPGTAAITELTYTVTDANGASTSQTFMVTVNDSLALTAPDDQSYTVDTAITDLVLLEASGGTGTLTYTLTGLPTGLTFTAASRTLSGTPTAAASTVLTYTVTDANGASTSQTFTVTVNDGLVLTTAGDQGYTLGTTITELELPEATGGTAPLTYALTDPPAGLTFNSASRRLTGTPGTAAITELTYTVTDANDASTSQTFMVTVNDSLALTAPDDQSYTVDTAITDLVLLEASGGTGTLTYTLTGLPTGLTFTAASRTLSGTPTAAASTVLTYTVTDTNDATASQTFTVTVNDGLVLTTAGDQGYTLGTTITELELPAATGGTAPLTYALTNLPDGLRFDAGTRTLSGTPGTAAITELTYTVTDANGASTSQTFMVTVNDSLALTAPDDQSYTVDTAITDLVLLEASGGTGTLTYTLTGLPTGLTFTAASRTLSGTPTAAASTVLTYTVTDANGASTSQTFTVTVNDGLVLTTAGDQGYTLGTTITELELPAATGGTAPLTYALTNLPDGLRFDAGTRTLSGTPGTAAITELTYTVTDANGASTSQTFMVTVNDSLALTAPDDQSYTVDTAITDLVLLEASGGTGTLTYTLTGLPTGLTFTAASRTLSGTPTAAASTVLTYTVTDANGASTSQTFMVTVNDGLVLTTAGDQGYTLDTAIDALILPEATGGTAPLTYALTDPPDGLRFDAGTRTLSGTPGTAAITELTYTVTDANGASTSQTFDVTVNDGVTLPAPGDQGYTLDTAIDALILPEATGGTAPLTYALTDPPAGLTFNSASRRLTGTPTAAAITELTYTVTDANDASTSQTFTVTVNDGLALNAPGAQGYTLDTTITDLELPEATGGTAPLIYALTDPPAGLAFNPTNRTLSGTPGMADVTVLTYTVTDANDATTSQTFMVTVSDGLALSAPPAQSYTAGTLITPLALSAATGGTGTPSYTLTGPAGADLPTGLTFTAASRTLSGTPTAAASTVLTYTVTDTNDATASQTFTVTVNDGLALNAPGAQGYTLDTAIDALILPEATGGTAPLTYALTDPPAGLTFNSASRRLTGTPTAAAITELTYTVTDANDASTSQTFTVTVNDGLALNAPGAQGYTLDTTITDLELPEATGGTAPLIYALTDPPAGLAFNPTNRTLSGTPGMADVTVLTYTVTDANDASTSQTFTVTVNDGLALNAPGAQGYTLDTAIDALILPEATGGTAPLTYALTDPPAGLTFNSASRRLTGTPTAAAITELTYTVTDANDASTSQTFMVTVNDSLALTAPDDQSYTVDTAITDLVLLEATGGTGTLSYTLTGPAGGALPAGLTFDTAPRRLTGTPTAMATTTLTYTVTDANDASTSQTFDVTVNDGVTLPAPGDQGYTLDTAIDALILPEATGGTAPLTYALTDPPAGLTFNSASRRLTGTPTAAAITELTYTVTDANDASTSQTFTVTVNDGLALNAPGAQGYTLDTTITDLELPAATGGTAPLIYALTDPPAGLAFNPTNRTLSGTPGTAAITELTYTVTDANDATTSQTFTVTVSDGLALSAPPAQSYTAGTLITPLALSAATGGTGTLSYTLTGPAGADLPTGLTFTAASRTLSGTPTAAASTVLTYTVTDTNDATASQTFTVTVNDGLVLTTAGDQGYTLGTTITELELPAATGGTAPLTYALTNLPDGLRFDAGTRTLSGTPGTAAITELTYTVTDANDASTSQTFTVTVNDGLVLTTAGDQGYTLDTTITELELPAATGGTAPLTYALTDPPDGLRFDAGTRTLSGTPGTAAITELTYTVTDANGASTSQTFMVTVNDSLALTAPDDQSYTVDTAIDALILPEASGGTGTLTYTLTGLPTGLTFTAASRTLSGTPTAAASTVLTYTVTDANGASTSQTFTVTVNDGLMLTTAGDQGYTLGTTITELELPAATGGTAPLTYALTNLPDGLRFDAGTRTLSGTPGTAASTELTYTVTDANDATATADFTVTVAEGLALALVADQSYTVDTAITDLILPAATGGTGTLTYTLTGLPAGLTFDTAPRRLTGTPTAMATTTLTYTVTDANGATATADFTVTVALPRFADLNRTILPEVARAIAGHTVGAIARRVTQARADGGTDSAGSFNLGGQTTVAGVAGALASHGQAMADGTLSLKDLLGGGDFVLPLNARAAAGAPGLSSVAFWGAGDYSNLDGSGGAVDWDGDLFSAHLGADARLRDDLLVGLAVSWSRVDLDYSDPGRSGDYEFGDYELDLTSFHPYVGWSALSGKLDLWATVGYGWGDLEIANEAQQASSDVEMRTVAVGGLGRLLKVGATTLRLKGDALLTEMEVEGSDEMAALTVDARRVRMILEGSRTHTLADGAQLEPSLEVGVRHDGGDGETGFGAELGGGVRYSNPVMGLTLEGRARTLVGRDSYGEWGVDGLIRLERGNGRGLSFNLSPGYGKTGSGTQRLWQQGLHDKIDGERDYGARMDLRLGYGLPAFGGRGLLTPYSEVTFGDSARNYRLGMEWELGALFELNLTGERHESSDGAADHAIMLKGEVRF